MECSESPAPVPAPAPEAAGEERHDPSGELPTAGVAVDAGAEDPRSLRQLRHEIKARSAALEEARQAAAAAPVGGAEGGEEGVEEEEGDAAAADETEESAPKPRMVFNIHVRGGDGEVQN